MSAIKDPCRPSLRRAVRNVAKQTMLRAGAAIPLLLGLMLVGSVALLLPRPADAQDTQLGGRSFTNRYARPGRPTMTIYLWGAVGNTGIWQVERDIDLIELLSAADVPGIPTDDPDFRQHVVLTIYRGSPNQRRQVYRERLEELVAESATYPDLQDEDILQIKTERRRRFSFSTITTYIGTASSLILLALRLTRVGR